MQTPGNVAASRASHAVMQLFLVQENLILLGGSVLFSVAFASPIPFMAGVAGELLWLALGSGSPGVLRWLDARRNAVENAPLAPAPVAATDALDSEHARRVDTLDRALATIRSFGDPRTPSSFAHAIARLETLRPSYRSLCETHQRIDRFLAATTEAELVVEAERLKEQFAAEKDLGVRLTIRQAIGAAQRRIEHRRTMAQLQRGIHIKLESLERSVTYFVSQGRALASSASFSNDVEALLAEIGPPIVADVESVRPPSVAPL
jgi:hypothetical protein